jgi:hypothetical protein
VKSHQIGLRLLMLVVTLAAIISAWISIVSSSQQRYVNTRQQIDLESQIIEASARRSRALASLATAPLDRQSELQAEVARVDAEVAHLEHALNLHRRK